MCGHVMTRTRICWRLYTNATGREAGLNVATAYAPDTPVDNLLLRAPKYTAFAAFFKALHAVSEELLRSSTIPEPVQMVTPYLPDGGQGPVHFPVGVEHHEYGAVTLISNYGCNNTGSECTNYSSACFSRVCSGSSSREVDYRGHHYYLPNRTVVFVNSTSGEVLFNTSNPAAAATPAINSAAASGASRDSSAGVTAAGAGDVAAASSIAYGRVEVDRVHPTLNSIETWVEQAGGGPHVARSLLRPAEQVTTTESVDTDYLWYSTEIPADAAVAGASPVLSVEAGKGTLLYAFTADHVDIPVNSSSSTQRHPWPLDGLASVVGGAAAVVDGTKTRTQHEPAPTNKPNANENNSTARGNPDTNTTTNISRSNTKNTTLYILSVAMGLSNVNPQPSDSKGIIGRVSLAFTTTNATTAIASDATTSHPTTHIDITKQPWTMSWPLAGEAKKIYTKKNTNLVKWMPLKPSTSVMSRVWFRFYLDLPTPTKLLPPPRTSTLPLPPQTAYALDLTGMNKGVAYVNGFNIGRYWLVLSGQLNECTEGMCALDFPGPVCYFHKKGCGKATQHLYHVPTELLKATGNLVVLFEESSNMQAGNVQDVALVVLHEHPKLNVDQ